jgi:inhibitor of KinA sporulation pathway (predicted exonuclease)
VNEFLLECAGKSLVVMDLEYTAWEGSLAANWSRPGEYREIVQIGAVKAGPDLKETHSFLRYVQPVLNPVLSTYFTELTGIGQQTIDNEGIDLATALKNFMEFAAGAAFIVSNGPDSDVIVDNCRLHRVECAIDLSRVRNVRPAFVSFFAVKDHDVDSSKLPDLINESRPGRQHDALSDARCVLAALRHMANASSPP